MAKETRKALSIWNNIEKIFGEQLTFYYEGNKMVSLDGIDSDDDAILFIQRLRRDLEIYQDRLEEFYGAKKYKKIGNGISLKMSHIYLMYNTRNGYYKIGHSTNPIYRERTIQSEEPEVEIIFISPLCAQGIERRLHLMYSDKRIRGEWFSLLSEDVDTIKTFDYGS